MTFVAGAANNSFTNSGAVAVNVPTGTLDGDVMLALCAFGDDFMSNTAWIRVATIATLHATLMKRIAASEPSSYTFTVDSGANFPIGEIVTYRGPTGVDTFDATLNPAANPMATASLVASSAGDYVVLAVGADNADSNYLIVGAGNLTRDESYDSAFLNASIASFSKAIAGSGATGVDQFATRTGPWSVVPTFTVMLNSPSAAPDPTLGMIQPIVRGRFA